MGRTVAIALAVALATAQPVLAQQAEPSKSPRSNMSSRGQFTVHSPSSSRRAEMLDRANAAREVWLSVLKSRGGETSTLILNDLISPSRLTSSVGARTSVFVGDGGAKKIQVDVLEPAALRGIAFEGEIFRALATELAYRDTPLKVGQPVNLPPAWLSEGLAEDMRTRQDGPPEGVFDVLLRSENPPKLDEFLKQKPELLEATSRAIYRTQALTLINALRSLPEGGAGIQAYVKSLGQGDGNAKALLSAFPSLEGQSRNLDKVWTLAIARASTAQRSRALTLPETLQRLEEILDLTAPSDPKKPDSEKLRGASALPSLAQSEGGPFLMRQKGMELLQLEFRSHPLVKPVIEEFRGIVATLAQKPKRNVSKPIEENTKILDLLRQRANEVTDYMNWFEATKMDQPSGSFLEVEEALPPMPRRTDALTRTLDAIEERGW